LFSNRFVKERLALAPNNASAWNYLRGLLDRNDIPYSRLRDFVRPYSASSLGGPAVDVVDLDNPIPSQGVQLPCPGAIEFLADIYEQEGGDSTFKATEVPSVQSCLYFLPYRSCSFGNLWLINMTPYERGGPFHHRLPFQPLMARYPKILGVSNQGSTAGNSRLTVPFAKCYPLVDS